MPEDNISHIDFTDLDRKAISKPVVEHIYTADPSAHVFDGKIFIYPSHDIESGIPFDDLGSHFAMEDYHVLSMDFMGGVVTDHGV
ncbi:MAG TPA: alpha-N-arabinofuranosidase, partial [Puia sp.]|nr:alpha-N-arabinofuranosidase [Puia sp.]